ncbi:flagellar protein FlaG [Metabacillus bambusae]|uniref:Flagellar protein FlaG n=1 Tax=Metabacillus bambusae TaxID=2795218 RepID=A0ABS3N0C6_9BACI|nr:flagellar protein FlaG [Metabacillus bambusae]MBO1511731.1 flagellar protein FlaG [Metabacillus bambusae]
MFVEPISSPLASHNIESTKTSGNKEIIPTNQEQIQVKSEEKPKIEEVENIVNSMNDFLQASYTHVKFEFHEKLNEYYVTIVDNETDEVVREIPSKKLLDIYSAMAEFLGFIIDEKV